MTAPKMVITWSTICSAPAVKAAISVTCSLNRPRTVGRAAMTMPQMVLEAKTDLISGFMFMWVEGKGLCGGGMAGVAEAAAPGEIELHESIGHLEDDGLGILQA